MKEGSIFEKILFRLLKSVHKLFSSAPPWSGHYSTQECHEGYFLFRIELVSVNETVIVRAISQIQFIRELKWICWVVRDPRHGNHDFPRCKIPGPL